MLRKAFSADLTQTPSSVGAHAAVVSKSFTVTLHCVWSVCNMYSISLSIYITVYVEHGSMAVLHNLKNYKKFFILFAHHLTYFKPSL